MKTSPGSELAALRRTETKPCARGGKPFTGLRRALYCSEACKQAAKYARKKRATLSPPRE